MSVSDDSKSYPERMPLEVFEEIEASKDPHQHALKGKSIVDSPLISILPLVIEMGLALKLV